MSKALADYTRDELLAVIKGLKARKKFGLVWEDKPENVAIMCAANLPVLFEATDKAILEAPDASTHLLIEGDNYHSLSVLNYTHAGQIDLIAIDPPYNTGANDFTYNDQYVDREDAFRHSKWLSFMDKRLRLAKNLLSDSGVIVMNIDENEFAQLKLLSDQIFGESNYVMDVIWNSRKSVSSDAIISLNHNHTLIYAKNISTIRSLTKKGERFKLATQEHKFSNPDNDPRGPWSSVPLDAPQIRANLQYTITNPITGQEFVPPPGRHWGTTEEKFNVMLSEGRVFFGKTGKSRPQIKRFLSDAQDKGETPKSIWDDVDTTTKGTQELEAVLGYKAFNNPKPLALMQRVIQLATDSDSTILDFFAGSGTTGHAVLRSNVEDGGNRKFILCTNNENEIAESITYQRIKGAIAGYKGQDAMPANVRYFKTDFVSKEATDDQTRIKLVERSQQVISLREATFDIAHEGKKFVVMENPEKYAVIIYDQDAIPDAIQFLNKTEGKEIKLYVFSLSNDSYESDFYDLIHPFGISPIPEGILEVYRRIFGKPTESVGE